MKKPTRKARLRDVKRTLKERIHKTVRLHSLLTAEEVELRGLWKGVNSWIDLERVKGLRVVSCKKFKKPPKNSVSIILPEVMDFNEHYMSTVQCITAIRKLVNVYDSFKGQRIPSKAYKLSNVDFDGLRRVSTSAAIVLTAEISKWDNSIRRRLVPDVVNWSDDIYNHFSQLGFFDLFGNKPERKPGGVVNKPELNFVRYLKGKTGNSEEAKEKKKFLKSELKRIVGSDVAKWTILHSGLSEAVTNVTHHAYPRGFDCSDPSWYLTGAYNNKTKEMKIVFYDQGIGIPNSLPESKIWEKVLSYFSRFNIPFADQKKDAALLKAAVSIDRTSTGKNDRGKGLQDLLEFIKQRGDGYMSLISYHGLYKYTITNGKEDVKSESFDRPLCGTLIIWSVNLQG